MEKEVKSKKNKIFLYVLTGLLSGVANGLFGGGGGMILVPMLIYVLRLNPKIAHASAIFLILPLSITSGIFYASFGTFNPRIGLPTCLGVVLGGALGAIALSKFSSKWIMIVFAIVMAVAGCKLLFF